MFNRPVHGTMPVLYCKPLVKDCDDDHHTKLTEKQQKNNNDTSAVFPCIPIGSAVAVQWEDSRPWTPGTIVGTGDNNHHDKCHRIQLTINGRCITCNRYPIELTSVTADAYIQYYATKQQNARTDPLAEILNNITKHPAAYATRQTPDACEQYNTKQKEEAKESKHYSVEPRNSIRKTDTQAVKDNKTIIKDGDTIRTKSGCISKKKQTDWHTDSHQHMPGWPVGHTNKCCTAGGIISQF